MSNIESNENETCGECGRPTKDSRDFANLRTERDALAERNKTLEGTILSDTIRKAGFDPDLEITKMVAEKFDGDITASDAAESFAAFAKAKGLTSPTGDSGGVEQHLDAAQSREDKLRAASNAQTPPVDDLPTKIAEAEAKGDVRESMRLKNQMLLATPA